MIKKEKLPERRRISWQWVIVTVLAAIPPTLASIGAFVITWRSGDQVKEKVEEVKKSTDGMKDALVKAAKAEGHAAGVDDEKFRIEHQRPPKAPAN